MPGRWMSPDRETGSYDFSNPQSFDRYSYVLNNPLSLVDPTGLDGRCLMPTGTPEDNNHTSSVPTQQECEAHAGIWIDFTINGSWCDEACQSNSAWAMQEFLGSLRALLSSNNAPLGPTTTRNGAPNNGPTWSQKNKDCLNKINETPDGKLYNTFSYTSSLIGPDASVLSFEQDVASEAAQRGGQRFLSGGWRSLFFKTFISPH